MILKKNHMEGLHEIVANHARWKDNPDLQKCCADMNDKILRARLIEENAEDPEKPDPQIGEDQS